MSRRPRHVDDRASGVGSQQPEPPPQRRRQRRWLHRQRRTRRFKATRTSARRDKLLTAQPSLKAPPPGGADGGSAREQFIISRLLLVMRCHETLAGPTVRQSHRRWSSQFTCTRLPTGARTHARSTHMLQSQQPNRLRGVNGRQSATSCRHRSDVTRARARASRCEELNEGRSGVRGGNEVDASFVHYSLLTTVKSNKSDWCARLLNEILKRK